MVEFLKRPKSQFIIIALTAVVVCAITGIILWSVSAGQGVKSGATREAPSFTALIPEGKTIDSLGGWQKMTPPSGDAFYVYNDTIDDTILNVSQQTLPENFKTNPSAQLATLAKAYNANETFEIDGMKIYLGTSAKGPQSVLFTKNDLLVLIKSHKQVSDDAWAAYIKSLK